MKHRASILGIVALLGVVIYWWSMDATRTATVARDELHARNAALVAKIGSLKAMSAPATALSPTPTTLNVSGSTDKPPAPPPQPLRSVPPAVSLETHLDQLANNAQIQLLALASKRAKFAEDFAPFFLTRGLSPEQIEKLCDAFIGRQAHQDDLDVIGRTQRLRPNDPAIVTQQQAAETEFSAAATSLLGPEGSAQLREYERTSPARVYAGKLAGLAAMSGIPFTTAQAEKLVATIANGSATYAGGGAVSFNNIDWVAVDANAAQILSPAQLRLFTHADPGGGPTSRWSSQVLRAVMPNSRFIPRPTRGP
jgi:hypothetical protein